MGVRRSAVVHYQDAISLFLVRDREISQADDVHSDQDIGTGQIRLGDTQSLEPNIARQKDVHKVDIGRPDSLCCPYWNPVYRLQLEIGDDLPGDHRSRSPGVPDPYVLTCWRMIQAGLRIKRLADPNIGREDSIVLRTPERQSRWFQFWHY